MVSFITVALSVDIVPALSKDYRTRWILEQSFVQTTIVSYVWAYLTSADSTPFASCNTPRRGSPVRTAWSAGAHAAPGLDSPPRESTRCLTVIKNRQVRQSKEWKWPLDQHPSIALSFARFRLHRVPLGWERSFPALTPRLTSRDVVMSVPKRAAACVAKRP